MAYSDIGDVSAGDPVAEAYLDQIRANFLASAPDAFTTKGDIFVATAADAGARLAAGADDSILVPDSGEATGLVWQIQPAVRVYNSENFDPDPNTWDTVSFDSERFDTDGFHSTTSNTDRLTVPTNGDGLYMTGATVEFDVDALGDTRVYIGVRIILNSTTVIAQQKIYVRPNEDSTISVSTLYSLVATDYLAVQVRTDENIDVLASGNFSPEFWAIWQRMP